MAMLLELILKVFGYCMMLYAIASIPFWVDLIETAITKHRRQG